MTVPRDLPVFAASSASTNTPASAAALDILSTLGLFSSTTRLYDLALHRPGQQGPLFPGTPLLVEAFAAVDALHELSERDLLLSTSTHLPPEALIGCVATLQVRLADGSRTPFSGLVREAALLGSESGLARYRIRTTSWLWLLSQRRGSRVWQDRTVIDIVDDLLRHYAPHAAWQWNSDARVFLQDAAARPYCVQYRETDLAFLRRLLAEEGLSWRIEEAPDSDDAPAGHRIVFIADTTQTTACPEDATSAHLLGGAGIRFHAGRATEEQDAIQALIAVHTLQPASVALVSYDYRSNRAVAATVPTQHPVGGRHAPLLESYDTPGVDAYAILDDASRHGRLRMQDIEARTMQWQAHSTVRTLRPGTAFALTQGPLAMLQGDGRQMPSRFAVLRVTSIGFNNLSRRAVESLAELLGPVPALLQDCLDGLSSAGASSLSSSAFSATAPDHAALLERAVTLGYANTFDAIQAELPWRPVLGDGTGLRQHPRPTAFGSQSAIVISAAGQTTPDSGDEVHCDALGRIRIRFHWQGRHGGATDERASC